VKVVRRLLFCVALVSSSARGQPLPVEEFDVSNQIALPRCEVEVQLRAMRWHRSASQTASSNPPDYVAEAKIKLNGKIIRTPQGFVELLGGANRIQNPPLQVQCGFVVATGDASTSGRLLVRISNGRIESAERIDSVGRVQGKTLFYHLKATVLN
jgi:hypothetical protein